jgi:hypothetical protein
MKDKELKKRWVEALRSGKYMQGDSVLRFPNDSGNDFYCCLGVLCDLIEPNNWVRNSQDDWCWAQQAEVLPDHYVEILGLNVPFKKYADMNDKEYKSFNEIADYIEANE